MPFACRTLAALCAAVLVLAAESSPLPPADKLFDGVMANGNLRTTTGEQFTWHVAASAHRFLHAYEAGGRTDPQYLAKAQEFYDWCIARCISNDPDGLPGTIGEDLDVVGGTGDTVADTLVGDANIALPLTTWATLVAADPALQARFGARAKEYTTLATRMLWEKWNKRGCYYQDARGFGSYSTHPFAIATGDRSAWKPRPSHLVSDNLNKHYKAGLVLLGLHRLTGEAIYRDRVVALFGRAKAMFRLLPDEDRLVWNFWMPHGAYDLVGTAPKSWVGVHPDRPGYQDFEAGAFLAVYDAGLVFDRTDLERMVRTNRWMIDHGMQSADGTSKAGTAWTAFAPFDEVVRSAVERKLAKDPVELAYLREVQLRRRGYDRLHVTDQAAIVTPPIPVQPGRKLSLAHPVPDSLETANEERIGLLARVTVAGTLRIDLLTRDGKQVLGNLATQQVDPAVSGFAMARWDGSLPAGGAKTPGEYLLRYTLEGEERTWPVTVRVGTARARPGMSPLLAAGKTTLCDFETPLDPHWSVEGDAGVAAGKPKSGANALRLGRRGKATLAFGVADDKPVRISFWAFDGGAKHGKASRYGSTLGLVLASGDTFAIRQTWRPYLNGDADVAWFNTGENQWFSPHPCGLGRAPGWNRWTFDCTAGRLAVTRDGTALAAGRLAPERFVPTGATGLVFLGPDAEGDPELWIDDLSIDAP